MNDLNEKQLDQLYKYIEAHPDYILLAAIFTTDEGVVVSGPDSVKNLIIKLAGHLTLKEVINGRA